MTIDFNNYKRFGILLLAFCMLFCCVFQPQSHALVATSTLVIGGLVVAAFSALGMSLAYADSQNTALYFGNAFQSYAYDNGYDDSVFDESNYSVGPDEMRIKGPLAPLMSQFAEFWATDNNVSVDAPVSVPCSYAFGYPVYQFNEAPYGDNFAWTYNNISYQFYYSLNGNIATVHYIKNGIDTVSNFTVSQTSLDKIGINFYRNYINGSWGCLAGFYCWTGNRATTRVVSDFFPNVGLDSSITASITDEFSSNVSNVQTETETGTETYIITVNPEIFSHGGDPNDPNNVSEVLTALLNLGIGLSLIDYITGNVGNEPPTPSPSPSSSPEPTPSPSASPYEKEMFFIPSGIGGIFSDDGFKLSGIWHYVTEWLSSISSGISLIFNVFNNLPWAMVVPIYASITIIIVFGIIRKLM